MSENSTPELTRIREAVSRNERGATDRLFSVIYGELKMLQANPVGAGDVALDLWSRDS